MILPRCNLSWGDCKQITRELRLTTISDAIYIPFNEKVFLDHDAEWGIFESSGSFVTDAAYLRGPTHEIVGGPRQARSQLGGIAEAPFETMVYGGPILPHYGHFILASLSRIWAIDGTIPVLFHSHPDLFEHRAPYIRDCLRATKLSIVNAFSFPRPTRIRQLIIPEASIVEQSQVSLGFLEGVQKIANGLIIDHFGEGGRFYLSKSRLNRGVSHLIGEEILEDVFKENGFQILYPEQLRFAEQVSLFRNAEIIAGTAGSAFHTLAFTPTTSCRRFIFTFDDHVNSNFNLIESFMPTQSDFFSLKKHTNLDADDREFNASYRIRDPQNATQDISDTLQQILPSSASTHFGKGAVFAHQVPSEESVPDHLGLPYVDLLKAIHEKLRPATYLHIGPVDDPSFYSAKANSIFISTSLVAGDVVSEKQVCLLFKMTSDAFFQTFKPNVLLNRSIDLSFLDGEHLCECLLRDFINAERHASPSGLIVLHDCLPVETTIAYRSLDVAPTLMPHRAGWWTGDVWRTVMALKKYRPELLVSAFDAAPTGLVVVSNLDPNSTSLDMHFSTIVSDMMSTDLRQIGIRRMFKSLNLKSTSVFKTYLEEVILGRVRPEER